MNHRITNLMNFRTIQFLSLFFISLSNASAVPLDSARIDDLVNQARTTMVSYPDSSRQVAFELYDYSDRNDYDWGRAQAYIFVGASFHRQGQFDTAIYYFDKTIAINETLKDSLQIGAAKLNKSMCLVSTGRYDEGAEHILESMKVLEQIMDTEPKAVGVYVRCFNIMGQVYYYQGDFEKTREYFVRYLEEAIKARDTLSIASANNNLGAVYYELGDYDKSLEHDLKGAEIHKHLNNPMGYANAMQNIATDLLERGEYEKAEKYLNVALEWYEKVPNEKGISEVYYNLGMLHYKRQSWKQSIQWYDKAMTLSKRINNPDVVKRSLLGLSDNYKSMGNYKKAYQAYKAYDAKSDSLTGLSHLEKVSELEIAYETEKKEQQIALQATAIQKGELELERNRLVMIILIVALLFVILVFVWIIKRQQYRRKILLEQERSRATKAQIEAVIQSQEKERSRVAMDLHDGFGQLISALRISINKKKPEGNEADELLDKMYASLKNIAFDLMPQTLMDKGLTEAIDELCFQLNNLGGIEFKMTAFEIDESQIEDHKVGVYRVIQEIVSNIIKYASASKVQISLTGLENELNIMIEDDGNGFDPQVLLHGSGNGWRNITSRLDLMKGSIEVDSTNGRKNTSVAIVVPYANQAKLVA